MKHDLDEVLEGVEDEETLIAFMLALAEDRAKAVEAERAHPSSPYGPDAGGWENTTIDTYLERAAAWAEASKLAPDRHFRSQNLMSGKGSPCAFTAERFMSELTPSE